MACRFPGGENLARYWQLVRDGRHAFARPPAERWDHDAFFSTSHRAFDTYYTPTGAYLKDLKQFAALEFAIPPRRVEVMDPQQRITLEASWNALQDAGYAPSVDRQAEGRRPVGRALDRSRVGTWVGLSTHEWRMLLSARAVAGMMANGDFGEPGDPQVFARAANRVVPPRAFAAAGVLGNMAAATVAQELDLGGPAYTTDAACASALLAVHDAVTYLRDGQVDLALAGGVYLNLSPDQLVAFSRIGAVSAAGVCRPFDVAADGFVQGEGVGMVVLKRLEDALRDQDRIYAVIRGSAVNNDGKGDGPMSPRAEGQLHVIRAAWADAGVTAERVGYVETHGTGTPVGDRTELGALRTLMADRGEPVAIGSAKANIGHTMSAAGVAGLIKAALAIHKKTLLPLANWTAAHPDLDPTVFAVDTRARPWTSVTPRVATVSSFGFGGTNAHAVLEEPPGHRPTRLFPAAVPAPRPPMPSVLVVVSADSGTLLAAYLRELAETVEDGADLDTVAHTLNLARRRRPVRCAVVADSLPALAARFAKAAAALAADPAKRGNLDRDIVVGDAATPVPVAFLCPGQGMQKVGLMREWLQYGPFADALARAESDVRDITPRPLRDYLYAPDATEEALTDTAIAQPAMFAVGVGVAAVLRRWGIQPAVVLGHSLGEFTAAALAGSAPERDTIRFVARRGRAMSDLPGDHGAMAAAMDAAEAIEPHLEPTVVVANRNHPRQNVISGPTEAVERSVERLNAAGIKARRIQVSHAFHSPLLERVQEDVEQGLGEVAFAAPTLPFASCIAEVPATDAAGARAIFRRHATSPVDYVRGLAQAREAGARIYIQLSAGATLTAFARGCVDDAAAIVAVAGDGDDGGVGLLRVLALCAAHGHPVDLTPFGSGLAPLPPVPLETQAYWSVTDAPQPGLTLKGASAARAVSAHTPTLPVPAEAPVAGEGVYARVLAAVGKVSAFPVESIRENARLLEDLGFDSLMANELSTRLGETFPGFPGIPRALLAQSPTVGDLVRHVEGAANAGEVPLTDPSRPLERWQPTLVPAPPCGARLAEPARVMDSPTLDELRKLAPAPLVVRLDPADQRPESHGIVGFVKSLAREWAPLKVQVVRGSLADAYTESALVERDPQVVWQAGVRKLVGLTPAEGAAPKLDGERVVVSGGTGWLGRVLARALLDAGVAEVVLLGTRPDAAEALSELGARARYVRVDVTTDCAAALADLGADGLVHAAGVLADGKLGSADGRKAWAVKVDGLRNLVAALPGLKWVSAIGSYAGFFGNAFQTEYAAANAGMAGVVARLRDERRVAAQVQIWGPWAGSEMVETIPLAIRRAMREDGVWFVDRDQGARAFVAALGTPGDVVLGLDLPAVRRVAEIDLPLAPDQPWLRDHALYGHPTVPMAMVLDLAGRLGIGELVDLTLYDGVVVDAPLTLRARREGELFRVLVGERVCWEARIAEPAALTAPPAPEGGEPAAWPLADFYRHHTFHGPTLQGLVSVGGVGEGFVHGEIRVGAAADWGLDAWSFSPLAIDSAFQLCAVYAAQKLGRSGFPVRVARWSWTPLPPGTTTLRAWGRFAAAQGDRFEGDVVLTLADGTVVAVGRGVAAELRTVGASAPPDVAAEHWQFDQFPAYQDLALRLQMAEGSGVGNPYFKLVDGTARDTVTIGGKPHLHFSGYNYLGFSGHPLVTRRVQEAVERYGTSVSASRVASGERPIHRELERHIANALGVDDSVVFTAGHATNVTTVGHLFGPKDLILHDELIHDSIFQGMKLAGATRRPFPHGDTASLARMLEQLRSRFEKVLIVVEGVYSMDGDLCDLPVLVELKERHRCFLMVDEAHSFGVVGKHGYGVREHFGVDARRVDIWMGTLSKSLSSCGGYIAGSRALVTLLKYTAPGFVYSAGLTAANTMAAIVSFELMAAEPEHVAKLQANCRTFYSACRERGLDLGPARGESAVIPVVTGNSYHALLLSDALMKRGINVQPILYPAVADNAARLRFFLSALHTEAQLLHTAQVCAEELERIRKEHPVG